MPKYQFQRTESLRIRIPPFLDKDAGQYIYDTDTCTMLLKGPTGDIITPTPTRDPDTYHWVADVTPPDPFVAGTYLLYAYSEDVGTPLDQFREYTWGDYVDDITAAKTAAQSADSKATAIKAKTDVPAAIAAAADIAAVSAKLGTPVVSVSADLATIQAVVTVLQAVAAGKWVIDTVTKQLIVSKSDGLGGWTEVARFDLFDKNGTPSASQIYSRIPH